MHWNFDQRPDRRRTESFKWRAYAEDVLPLFVADMDFRSPEPVAKALRDYLDQGVFGYPRGLHTHDCTELPEICEAVMEWVGRRYGWRIEPDEVVLIPGVVPGLNLACHAFAKAGDAVLVQPPVYPHILGAAGNAHLIRQESALERQPDGSYSINWDAFAAAFTSETRLFILCNPHNPTGRVFRHDELRRMAEICLSRGVIICSDEIHGDLLFSGHRHIPMASIDPEVARQTITLLSPSKTFNLAGLQCSIAVIQNPDLRRRFGKAREGMVPWVNVMGLIAAEAAFRHGQPWLDELLRYLEGNRNHLAHFVGRELPGIQMTPAEGTYLAWMDCRSLALESPYDFFLKRARVALNDGVNFGTGGKSFVRLNFGCPRSVLEDALNRMKQALDTR